MEGLPSPCHSTVMFLHFVCSVCNVIQSVTCSGGVVTRSGQGLPKHLHFTQRQDRVCPGHEDLYPACSACRVKGEGRGTSRQGGVLVDGGYHGDVAADLGVVLVELQVELAQSLSCVLYREKVVIIQNKRGIFCLLQLCLLQSMLLYGSS